MDIYPHLTLLAILFGLALMIVDLFIKANYCRHAAYILFSLLVASRLPDIFQIRFMGALVSWIGLLLFDYYLWHYVSDFVQSPEIASKEMAALIGKRGKIIEDRRRKVLMLEGRRYPVENTQRLFNGQMVLVVAIGDKGLRVAPVEDRLHSGHRQEA